MHYFEQEATILRWRGHGETVEVIPWGPDGLRVRAAMMHEVEDARWALLEPQAADVQIEIGETQATLRCGRIIARMQVNTWRKTMRLVFENERGETLLAEETDGGALALRARHFKPIPGGEHGLRVTFVGDSAEHLYGMGQYQLERVNLNHCTLELAHRNSQASVPFVISSKGYGLLWHNPAVGRATFSDNAMVWEAESTRQMDYYICAGDSPRQISLRYAQATGFAPPMPEWGLGFWQCKLRYWNQEQLLEVAREHKRRGLPMDVIVCDFFHWPKMGDFRFEEAFFPDPAAMVRELREMGIELMVSVWPQVSLESENYEEMRQQNLLVRADLGEQIGMRFGGDSMFFDATNPRARRYVWDKCRRNYYDKGIRLFWLDEAEPEYGTYDFGNYRYNLGPVTQVGNIYPALYSRTFYDGLKEAGETDIVNLVRCAWAGSQRYGALVWSGDVHCTWEDFRKQLCAGLSMGAAGIPWWTTDIGGFSGGNPDDPAFRELLIRWFQWGAYSPVMRLHGDRVPSSPVMREDGSQALFTGAHNEVWSFGEEAYPILCKYLERRESMRADLRAFMDETHRTGVPVMRAMWYEYPQDAACAELTDQYLLGGKYLVAPVMAPGVRERPVYLPAGSWRCVETGEVIPGGQWITAPAPLHVMPVYERMA